MKLVINNVHKTYREGGSRVEVLRGINCEVETGQICILLGPSGSGKSTLQNIIGEIEQADSGCIDIGRVIL
jgi:ABC-type antimicrobial peptide transport system, ATPase component